MDAVIPKPSQTLVGIGLYTPAEAGRLIQVSAHKITRWLRGHETNHKAYAPLWQAQVDLGADGLFLGFRDLMEVRVAASFIAQGLSPQKVRQAIMLAREIVADDHPLSTLAFRTDGRSVFLELILDSGEKKLIDLFRQQYAFRHILERSLKNVDYDASGAPSHWWPLGRARSVVIDPERSFGQPIEAESSVPVRHLASAAKAEGSVEVAAQVWSVPVRAVKRAVAFEREMDLRTAA